HGADESATAKPRAGGTRRRHPLCAHDPEGGRGACVADRQRECGESVAGPSAARNKEVGIRTALGAGRWRILRQLLTEGVLLGMMGGLLGLALGVWGARALLAVSPGDLRHVDESAARSFLASIDYSMLGFTLAVSIVTGILFGLVPELPSGPR